MRHVQVYVPRCSIFGRSTWMNMFMNITAFKSAYIGVYLLNAKLLVRPKAKLEMHMSDLLIFGS